MHERAMPSMPKRAAHEQKLDEMHDALHRLGSQARPDHDYGGDGAKLLPEGLGTPREKPGAKAAKRHINRLHKAFKKHAKEK